MMIKLCLKVVSGESVVMRLGLSRLIKVSFIIWSSNTAAADGGHAG
jgi:hypothetical protein